MTAQLIVAIALPVPLGLMPELLKAATRWHKPCAAKGCIATLRQSGGHILLEHSPDQPTTDTPQVLTVRIGLPGGHP